MALLDELFGPYPDLSSPEAIESMLRRAQVQGVEAGTPSGVPGITLAPVGDGQPVTFPGAGTPPQQVATPPPSAPVVPPARRAFPQEEVNPLERLGAILAGLGDRGQGA